MTGLHLAKGPGAECRAVLRWGEPRAAKEQPFRKGLCEEESPLGICLFLFYDYSGEELIAITTVDSEFRLLARSQLTMMCPVYNANEQEL